MILRPVQITLRRILPDWCFDRIHKLAVSVYTTYIETSYRVFYASYFLYCAVRRDAKNLQKLRAVDLLRSYSLVGRAGLFNAYELCAQVEKENLAGGFVECGVARGGCSALMSLVAAERGYRRKIWLFDSFEGLPEPTSKDPEEGGLARGSCLGTYEEVEELLFSRLNLDRNSVSMVKGWFQNTLPQYRDKVGTISVLRIDADWYESIKCCLDNLYDKVVKGGFIIIDDYGALAGCREAVHDFLNERNIEAKLIGAGWTVRYFRKP